MYVSYKWLSEYIDLHDISPYELAEKLTRAGVEVEGVERRTAVEGLDNQLVVGYVQDCVQHPNADKLSLCQVDIGEQEPSQIVCGASNVAQGQKVPVAKVGAILPGDFKIKKSKIRGEVSQGMICSAQELGVEERLVPQDYKEGIVVLPDEAKVGGNALSYMDLDDHVLELELTPNRSDCLSMMGVAYEVGAILERDVHVPEVPIPAGTEQVHDQVQVHIEADDLCPHYVAKKVKNVQLGPSPLWLQNRLISANIRPINNVVDVTNYVMLEYGQPLHAFDASKVTDGKIIVRRAGQGEQVVTLDDQQRTLDESMLAITDPEKVIAVAGVMGAANSEVTAETTDIILESAYFEGRVVRHTSKKLELRSEASMRFEKGIDPEGIQAAVDRASSLLAQYAGADIVEGVAEQQVHEFPPQEISLNMVHLNQRLGTKLTTTDVTNVFERLTFEHENLGHEIKVEVPTRRPDLMIEEDLMEEVARLYGYENIPTKLPEGITTPGSLTKKQSLRRNIKQILQGTGLHEALTYSLTKQEYARWGNLTQAEAAPIGLALPMSEDKSHLRTTLIPQLLEVLQYNRNRTQKNIHVFEVGRTFVSEEENIQSLPEEQEVVSAVFSGLWHAHPWQHEQVEVDFYVAKGIVERLLEALHVEGVQFVPTQLEHYHPGRTARITIGDHTLGVIGQVHPHVQKQFELEAVYAFELSVDTLLEHVQGQAVYEPLPKHPSIRRDLAVIVDNQVLAGQLQETIVDSATDILKSVQLFDVYEGKGIEEGKKSLAYSLVYQDPQRTLTDEEVTQVHEQIVHALQNEWNAELRK